MWVSKLHFTFLRIVSYVQEDYRQSIRELDEKQIVCLRLTLCEMRNQYVSCCAFRLLQYSCSAGLLCYSSMILDQMFGLSLGWFPYISCWQCKRFLNSSGCFVTFSFLIVSCIYLFSAEIVLWPELSWACLFGGFERRRRRRWFRNLINMVCMHFVFRMII